MKLTVEALNSILGTPEVDHSRFRELYSRSPYRAIRYTLYGSRSMARLEHHNTIPYAFLNKETRIWLRIVRACLILGSYFTSISFDRVCLVYSLMIDISFNVGVVIYVVM